MLSLQAPPARWINYSIEQDKEQYFEYLKHLQGKLTPQKENYIQAITEQLDAARSEINNITKRYLAGELKEAEVVNEALPYHEIIKNQLLWSKVTSQYTYIKENVEQRYFVYYNGWTNLFQNIGMDLLLILLIFVFITPIFCTEYEMQMDVINRTCKMGVYSLYISKISAAGLISIICSFSFSIIEIGTNIYQYGLPGSEYSLQSIPVMGEHPFMLSIRNTLVLFLAIKMLGVVFLAMVIIIYSLLLKKIFNTVFITLLTAFAPFFLIDRMQLYQIPFLSSLLDVKGYVQGIVDSQTGDTYYLSLQQVEKLCLISIGIILFLVTIGVLFYHFPTIKIKKKVILTYLLFFLMITSGCKKENNFVETEYTCNEMVFDFFIENGNWIINTCEIPYTLKNKKTNKRIELFHDAFLSENDYQRFKNFFVTDRYLCYQRYLNDYDYDIVRLDLNNFEEVVLYSEQKYSVKGVGFMGIKIEHANTISAVEREAAMDQKVDDFFVAGNSLFLRRNKKVIAINLETKKEKKLLEDIESMTYSNGFIYLLNQQYELMRYDIFNDITIKVMDALVFLFWVQDEKIIFQALDGTIGIFDMVEEKVLPMSEEKRQLLNADKEYIYYCYDAHHVFASKNLLEQGELVYQSQQEIVSFRSMEDGERYYVALIGEDHQGQPILEVVDGVKYMKKS